MSRIVFLHGLESRVDENLLPIGSKATFLRKQYGALTPALDTREAQKIARDARRDAGQWVYPYPGYEEGFATPLKNARAALSGQTELLIGSSFGGAVLMRLLHEAPQFRGMVILVAGAGPKLTPHKTLPPGVKSILIHGRDDDVVPFEDSVHLAKSSDDAELWTVSGKHFLDAIVEDGALKKAVDKLLAH